jgi:hypothetical protein
VDKDFLEFLNGNKSAAKIEVIFLREEMPNGSQHITIKLDDKPIYDFWVNPKKPRGEKPPPKNAGGKKPYIMIMVNEVKKLREQEVKNVEELIGYLVCLAEFVEWGTGRLINKRSKKQLKYDDLRKMFTCSHIKLNQVLTDLKKYDLLTNNSDGYFISSRFIKKGKSKQG